MLLKKYEKEDKEMEVSSENEENFLPEKKRIDEKMKKRNKKKGMYQFVSAEIYGIHNKKKRIYT